MHLHQNETTDDGGSKQNGDIDHSDGMATRDTLGNINQMILLYVGQLLYGCQDSQCTEVTCRTGCTAISQKPQRKHTLRSARGLALTLCASPRPRAHLCRYFSMDPKNVQEFLASGNDTSPRDPSSIMQLLVDTSIRSLETATANPRIPNELLELRRMHERLDVCLQAAGRLSLSGKGAISNIQLANELLPCLQWLLAKLPVQRLALWTLIDRDIISKGLAYPQKFDNTPSDEKYNNWLVILDVLANESYLRLFGRMMLIISCRKTLTMKLHVGSLKIDPEHFQPYQSVCSLLATRICSRMDETSLDYFATLVWLKKLFAKQWDGSPVIKFATICDGTLDFMVALGDERLKFKETALPSDPFRMPLIAQHVSMIALAQAWNDVPKGLNKGSHILNCTILFSPEQLARFFRVANHLMMRTAHSDVEKVLAIQRRAGIDMQSHVPNQILHAEQHYLLLNVSRTDILKDTFDQLWQRRKGELRRPLRVRLGEVDDLEIGHDLGGVQIEFFNLICRQIFSEEAQMFTTDPTTGCSYFRPGSLQPLYMFELFGCLVALALYNGITLPITLPLAFYILLSQPPDKPPTTSGFDLFTIMDGWPVIARSLHSIMEDHVAGLEVSYPIEANGLRLTTTSSSSGLFHPRDRSKTLGVISATDMSDGSEVDVAQMGTSWPGWTMIRVTDSHIPEVSPDDRAKYVADYIRHLCYFSVAPQLDAFYKGFHESGVIDYNTLMLLRPPYLKFCIEGTTRLDILELKAATRYDGYDPKSRYIHWFWRIVTAWPESKQKLLLKFVTAAERIPISGASNLTFIIKKFTPGSPESLPTSSTCFGTLLLPRYPSMEVMSAKLSLALKYGSEGFGTG